MDSNATALLVKDLDAERMRPASNGHGVHIILIGESANKTHEESAVTEWTNVG